MSETQTPVVGVIMGSQSDWETMKAAADVLERFERAARVPGGLGAPDAGLDGRLRG